jgi:hypothetical protein
MNGCAIAFLRGAIGVGLTAKQLIEEQDFAPLRITAAYINLIAFVQ